MTSPSARYALGQRLRQLRSDAKLRGVDLAALLGITQGQLSKIENGKRRISLDQVRSWAEHTHADTETIEQLVAQAHQVDSEVTAWKERFQGGWDNYQKSYAEVERASTEIRAYQISAIHGLLQAPAYTEFIQREIVGLTDEQITAGLTAMRNRQHLLYEPTTRLSVILAEHVLRHRFPGAAVMIEQLHRIAQLAVLPSVDLAVIPTDTDMPLPYMVSFDLFTMPNDEPDVVFIELDTQEVRESEPSRVAVYARRHEALRNAALTGQAAIDFVLEIAREMTATLFAQDR